MGTPAEVTYGPDELGRTVTYREECVDCDGMKRGTGSFISILTCIIGCVTASGVTPVPPVGGENKPTVPPPPHKG